MYRHLVEKQKIEVHAKKVITIGACDSNLAVGDFFKVDKKKGNVATLPESVVVSIAFDDGSVATMEVK